MAREDNPLIIPSGDGNSDSGSNDTSSIPYEEAPF